MTSWCTPWDHYNCHCSGCRCGPCISKKFQSVPTFVAAVKDAPVAMIGRAATAPCGHRGEVVVGNYVKCLEGCDAAIPEHVESETTQPYPASCPHANPYGYGGHVWCRDCGKKI